VDSGHKQGVGLAEAVLAILDEEKDLNSDSETGDISFGAANGERRDPMGIACRRALRGETILPYPLSSFILLSQSLTDSLSVALSEDLTPTFKGRHSQTPSLALSFYST